MAGAAPKTDKWTARENEQETDIVLIVSGLVQVSNTNQDPVLTEGAAAGSGKTLVLDLKIRTGGGDGLTVLVWKRATFSKDVSANHYDKVEIRFEGKPIATVDVKDDDEHHEHLVALTQRVNKGRLPAPPKPKSRPAPKKRAPAAPKKRPAAAKKRPPAPKKRKSAAAKKRVPTAKKRGAAKRTPAAAKKRKSAAKKRPSGARKRKSAARRR
jgi:hypothetical protein